MKMKRKTRIILILSLLVMLAVGIKPISHGIGKAVLQVISDRMDYEDAYRQKAYEQIVNSQLQDATKDWVKALRKNADIQYFDK